MKTCVRDLSNCKDYEGAQDPTMLEKQFGNANAAYVVNRLHPHTIYFLFRLNITLKLSGQQNKMMFDEFKRDGGLYVVYLVQLARDNATVRAVKQLRLQRLVVQALTVCWLVANTSVPIYAHTGSVQSSSFCVWQIVCRPRPFRASEMISSAYSA